MKRTNTKRHKNSLEVCFRFAFCAEARAPSSALESLAKVFAAAILVHDEATKRHEREKNPIKTFSLEFSDDSRRLFLCHRSDARWTIKRSSHTERTESCRDETFL